MKKRLVGLALSAAAVTFSPFALTAPPLADAGAPGASASAVSDAAAALEKAKLEEALKKAEEESKAHAKDAAVAAASEAKVREDQARAATTRAAAEAKTADLSAAEVRNGKLIEHGITGGVAVGVHAPLDGGNAAVATIPYLLLLPGYWGGTNSNNAYCASSWSGGDSVDATKAAQSKARKRAGILFDVAVSKLRARGTSGCDEADKDGKPRNWCKEAELSDQAVNQIAAWLANKSNRSEGEQLTLKEDIINSISESYWNSALAGRCLLRKFGAWVGRPLDYKISDSGTPTKDRSVASTVAFGLAFAPNAYVSALAGVTYGTVDDTKAALWAISAGIGGNLDIATLLTK